MREAKEETSLDIGLGPLLYTQPWTDGRIRQQGIYPGPIELNGLKIEDEE